MGLPRSGAMNGAPTNMRFCWRLRVGAYGHTPIGMCVVLNAMWGGHRGPPLRICVFWVVGADLRVCPLRRWVFGVGRSCGQLGAKHGSFAAWTLLERDVTAVHTRNLAHDGKSKP